MLHVFEHRTEAVFLDNVIQAEEVVFSDDGYIYCAHSPRSGGGLRVTRIPVANTFTKQTVSLPAIEGEFKIGMDTSTSAAPAELLKHERAFSLAVAPGGSFLYVSQGRTIFQIFTPRMEVLSWRGTVELLCRLITVKNGPVYKTHREVSTNLVYAVGAKVKGDGKSVTEYKTQLYALVAPK